MLSLAVRKIKHLAQDFTNPSVDELGARLERGALKLGLAHAPAPEFISIVGQGCFESLAPESRFTIDDRGGAYLLCDLADERDGWIENETVLEKILGDAAPK